MVNGNDEIKMNILWIVTMNKKQMSGGQRTRGHLFENVSLWSDRDRHGVRLDGADITGFGANGVFLLCLL